jgi:hypothetical protein
MIEEIAPRVEVWASSPSRYPPHRHSRHLQFTTRMAHRFLQIAKKIPSHSSTISCDTRGRPALFPLQRHPVIWNCWYQRLMLLADGAWRPAEEKQLLRKLQHTKRVLLQSRHFLFIMSRTKRERVGGGLHMIKTWIPAASFHVRNTLLHAFPKPLWPLESALIILVRAVFKCVQESK